MKKSGLAMSAALALASVSPAMAQSIDANVPPIKIGVMDLKANEMTYKGEPGVTIDYREFNDTQYDSGSFKTTFKDHGSVVLTAAVRELRKMAPTAPIEVYSANVFIQGKKRDGSIGLKFQYDRADEALEWLKSKGVRVVVTAFNTHKAEEARGFMDKAESLGMIVYAGASNMRGQGKVFPAADPRAISVADTTPGQSSLTLDKTVDDWVMFGANGQVSYDRREGKVDEHGSSFATPKAAAYGAYWVWRRPEATRDEIADAMKRNAEVKRHMAGSIPVYISTLGSAASISSFMREAVSGRQATALASAAKAPRSVGNDDVSVFYANLQQKAGSARN